MAESIRDLVDEEADRRPDAPFLVAPEPGLTISYRALRDAARRLDAGLTRDGIAPGDVVAFMLPNGVSAALLFVGLLYAGRVVAPQNLVAQDSYLAYALDHSGARRVYTTAEHAPRLARLAHEVGGSFAVNEIGVDGWPELLDGDAPGGAAPAGRPAGQSPGLLMYTSGTTGQPKGALLSHANLVAAARAVAGSLALTVDDRVLSSLPLYHVNGQCIATLAPLASGGSIVMPHRFSVTQWWPLVERHRPTWINVVPTIIAYLLNGPELTPGQQAACRAVRFARSASAPLPPDQHRAFEARFDIPVIEAMGLTECASVAFTNGVAPEDRRLGSPGRPLGMDAHVVRRDGTPAADGEVGEVHLRGPNVMVGYHRAPELTAQAIDAEGWLATGDLGYRDADGFYFITGRLKELIIKGGENIAPREVDEALLRHPAVLECAAVGVPDAAYGQDILACVVLKPGQHCTEEELRAHALRELGRFKSPRYLRFVTDLPKGPSGKVQRLKLLDIATLA